MELYNELNLTGQITKVYPLKHTPIGLSVMHFLLEHKSMQLEAGSNRMVKCKIYCILVDAKNFIHLNLEQKFVNVIGFLSQNSKAQIVLHINQLKFLDKGI